MDIILRARARSELGGDVLSGLNRLCPLLADERSLAVELQQPRHLATVDPELRAAQSSKF
jgi:hypothetical protein